MRCVPRVGPRNHALDRVPDPSMGRGNFEGDGWSIVKYRDTEVIYAKMAEPMEIPFGLWAWMGPRNPVLDGGPEP